MSSSFTFYQPLENFFLLFIVRVIGEMAVFEELRFKGLNFEDVLHRHDDVSYEIAGVVQSHFPLQNDVRQR